MRDSIYRTTRTKPRLERCVWTSEPPIGVGSTYDQQARFMGREIVSSFEVVEFVPGRKSAYGPCRAR